jgi:hypothetical protein
MNDNSLIRGIQEFLTKSLDKSEITKNFEKLNKILENYLQKEEEKPREIIKFYYLSSEVSKNKTSSSLSTQGRTDFMNSTIYNIYRSDDNSVIGETSAFYNKVPANLSNSFFYNKTYTTSFLRGNIINGFASAIFDKDEKKFIFPKGTIEIFDFNGNKVRIEKLPDDLITPDKIHYKISFFD